MTISNTIQPPLGRFSPTFDVSLIDQAPASANYILAAINCSATKGVFLRRLIIWNMGIVTVSQKTTFEIVRLTAASSGGTPFTPQPYDVGNTFGGICLTGNPTVTAAATPLVRFSIVTPAALTYVNPISIDLTEEFRQPIIVPNGVNNGIALRVANGAAGAANMDLTFAFTEEMYA